MWAFQFCANVTGFLTVHPLSTLSNRLLSSLLPHLSSPQDPRLPHRSCRKISLLHHPLHRRLSLKHGTPAPLAVLSLPLAGPVTCGYCPHPSSPKQPHQPALKKPPKKSVIILSAIALVAVAATIFLCCFNAPSSFSSPETPEERAAYRCCLDIQNDLYFPSTFKIEKDIGYYEFTTGSRKLKYILIQYSADTQNHSTASGIDYYRVSDSGGITYLGDDSVYCKGSNAPAEMRQFYILWNNNSPTKSFQIPMGRVNKWLNAS